MPRVLPPPRAPQRVELVDMGALQAPIAALALGRAMGGTGVGRAKS